MSNQSKERCKKILDRNIATEYKYFVLIKNNFNDVRQTIFCAGFHIHPETITRKFILIE